MLKVGVRVVRGPNWARGNEDGGEGYVGTLREVDASNKTAVVQWDNGNQIQCRVGYLQKYDIRVIDNAQIGIMHKHVICDGCNSNMYGMRYKCNNCYDYDLCCLCYHADKHDLSHSFRRIETSRSAGINLPSRLNSRKCELKGIFKGAEVVRGVDWEWSNQDGGQGKLGIVTEIKGWKDKSKRSTVNVQWLHGNSELYRLGHKGYCDIQFVEAASGGYYYPDHLPILGQTEEQMEFNQILDIIEIQQVMQLETENQANEAQMMTEDDEKQKLEKDEQYSTLARLGSIDSIYASKIMEYNNAVSRGTPKTNLVNEFNKVVGEFRNDEAKEVWKMIQYMVQLPEISPSEDVIKTRYTNRFMENMVKNAKKYLEDSYKVYVSSVVNKSTSSIETLDTYQLVHNFVGIRFEGEYLGLLDGLIDERPLWPMVYYSIRLGDITTAIACLERCPLVFHEIISILKAKLKCPNDASVRVLEEHIRFSYRTVIRNDTDPYKRVIWSILGGCNELCEVIKTADDFLWYNLSVVRTDAYDEYVQLQYTILEEHGETHYNAFSKPLLYFKLLVLTGQFEAAVDFLFRTENFKVDGTHMAVALNEMNLLALPQDFTVPLISLNASDPRSARRLNLALLIKSYVARFEEYSLNGALHYFFSLRNCVDAEGKNLFEVLVSDLAINTKDYERLFGKLQSNGNRTMGLLDQFKNVNVRIEAIAQSLVEKELYEEAIDLYLAVNDQDGVLTIMCSALSKVAHLENQTGSLRNRLQEKAIYIERQVIRDINKSSKSNVAYSFIKLKGLLSFFDLYRAKQYPDALKELFTLGIVPLRLAELNERVKNTKNFNDDLFRILRDVLLATMTILQVQCDRIKKTGNSLELDSDKHLQCIWEQANCIVNFAERLPQNLLGNITHRLVQMENLMHC